MTWRDVLDCKTFSSATKTRDTFAATAHGLGYKFFAFNGDIYFVAERNGAVEHWPTGITAEQLRTFHPGL